MTLPSEAPASSGGPLPGDLVRPSGLLLRILAAGRSFSDGPEAAVDATPYRSFLEALGVAVYTTDADGRITFFNDAAVAFWGRRPELGEEWCGSQSLFQVDGTPLPHDVCPMAIALKEQRPVRGMEAIAERPDGSRVQFVPCPTPLFDDDGKLAGAVNVLIDITERRRTEERLRATDRALAAATTVRDEFLGLVSHELRTPVTTIFGNATLLEKHRDRLPEHVRDGMIADIAAEAGRLHSIVDNLLHLTRLESGVEIELEPHVLQRMIAGAVRGFGRRHPERQVEVSMPIGPLLVSVDATYVELLVSNLLSNANKYSELGHPIEIAVVEVAPDAHVVVRDRGIGLEPGSAEELFQPFFRATAARATAGGLGIGLALCQRIAGALGGRIWAAPRTGGGAEFGVALPLSERATLD